MKTAWNIVSFLAVVHLLALLMFAGWLWQTDRLDGGRITAIQFLDDAEALRAVLLP